MTRLRYSTLKLFAESPHAFRSYKPGALDTASTRIGTALHKMVLGVGATVHMYEGTRRGKEWDAFRSTYDRPGHLIVSRTECMAAAAMASAVGLNDVGAVSAAA